METTGIRHTTPAADSLAMNPVAADLSRLREAVGQVCGSVFFGALLKAMRESELKGSFGHGGFGEEVFGAQLHGVLAERAGTSMQNEVAETLYQRLAKQQERIGRWASRMGGTRE